MIENKQVLVVIPPLAGITTNTCLFL